MRTFEHPEAPATGPAGNAGAADHLAGTIPRQPGVVARAPAQRAQVEAMAGYGISPADIALALKLDPNALRQLYPEELATGHIKANAKVAENLYRKATGDGREAVTAAIFWLKTRASWKETSVAEITHDVADPVRGLMQRIAEKGRRLHDRD